LVPCHGVFVFAASAEWLAISEAGALFGSDFEAIPDRVRARWRRGAEFAFNIFCPAIEEKLYFCWPHTCSRLNLKVEVPLSTTEVFQKAVSRSGV
jgi:hypothetical protein